MVMVLPESDLDGHGHLAGAYRATTLAVSTAAAGAEPVAVYLAG